MKKILFTAICSLLLAPVTAQDIIMKKNADEIEAVVTKVGTTEIEYKKWDNPDGPTYTIPAEEVFVIRYRNGTKERISDRSTGPNAHRHPNLAGTFPRYQGEFAVAYGVGVGEFTDLLNMNRIVFETVHGARINPYIFAGVGVGFNYFYGLLKDYSLLSEDDTSGVMPLFADFKAFYPFSKKASCYFAFDAGAIVGVSGLAEGADFYTSLGPGIRFGKAERTARCDVSIRFQHMGTGTNAILFRIGCAF